LKRAMEFRGGGITELEGRGEGKGVSELRKRRVLGTSVVTLRAQALPRYIPNKRHDGDLD
jgi:hypothetical protein